MNLSGRTILLVEDEAIIALKEERFLRGEGFNVVHVFSGSDAIETVRKDPSSIDMILMDIDLGKGIDGTEAAREILREHDIPLLFLSSHMEKEILDKAKEITSYGYVIKGSGEDLLLTSIEMAFKLHSAHTEIRVSKEAKRKSDEKFRLLVEMAPAAITVINKGITTYSNSVFADMFCYESLEDSIGKHIADHAAQECREEIESYVDNREKGLAAPLSYEITGIRRNGEKFPLNIKVSRVTMPEGMVTIAFFTDLSEYYKVYRALSESEERLRMVVEGGNIGFWDYNVITGEAVRNKQWSHMLGIYSEETGSTYEQWLDLLHPEDRGRVENSVNEHLKGNLPLTDNEYRILTKDGTIKWVRDRGMIIKRDENGKPVRMAGIILDITDRKIAEAKLKQYADELQASNSAKDKFFSILSHDLKGPFGGFLGLTKELADNMDSMEKEEINEIASVMYHSAEEMYELLSNMLEWSRLQTGKYEFNTEETKIYNHVEGLKKLFFSAAARKSISIVNNVPADIKVFTDRNALSTIFRNLIDNAIKFTNLNGTVTIDAAVNGRFAEISVTDTGIGISAEALKNLFRIGSGYTTPGTDGEKGTGLGLILCKDFISMLGGEIKVTNCADGGTSFIFTLPAESLN